MNLFVGNLNPVTTAAGLRQLFSEFGEVISSKIIMDNATGQPRGFGFVEMADKFHSFDAIDNIDATFFEGNVISVKEAKQNNVKGGGGGRKPSFNKPGGFKPGGFNKPAYSPRPRPNPRPNPDVNRSNNDDDDRFNRL
ncbi:MAG: RNA-binding protein [Flavipsychrobacter sp.]|nr:RNA-binding protein [Flavipsychrobacter sp.]